MARRGDKRAETLQAVVDAFNERNPVGTLVRYWRGFKQGPGELGPVYRPAIVLGGHTPIVWIEGAGWCIALDHVDDEPAAGAGEIDPPEVR